MRAQWPSLLALALSVISVLMALRSWWSVSQLRKRSSVRSFRALSELSNEVSDLRSLFKLLQVQQKKFAARSGGRPPKNQDQQEESGAPPKDSAAWKTWARKRLAENIANKRPPASGIGG